MFQDCTKTVKKPASGNLWMKKAASIKLRHGETESYWEPKTYDLKNPDFDRRQINRKTLDFLSG
jgi:hypothetical protein